MKGYVLKRIIIAILTMFVVVTVVFFVFRLGGADPVSIMMPPDASPADAEKLILKFGLDKPLVVQYLNFLKNAVKGDFGDSFRYSDPALGVLMARFPATLQLALIAFLMSVGFGLTIGIISAVKPDSLIDRLGRLTALAGMSLPTFWVGVMLILFFGVTLRWLPIAGRGTPLHYLMPAFCMSLYPIALITRLSRSTMMDALKSDYVVMARIKGVPEWQVILVHAFKNASIPVVTIVFGVFGGLILGSVVVETIFAWPGIGLTAIQAIEREDLILVQAIVFTAAISVVLINIAMDFIYKLIDPRLKLI